MDQELIAFLEKHFREAREENREQISGLREEMSRRFEQVDQRFEQVDRRFEQVDRRFERTEETDRHTRILIEDLHGHLRLMAEGWIGLYERMDTFQANVQREIRESQALLMRTYPDLNQRVHRIEERLDLMGRDPIEVIRERFGLGKQA